MLMFERRRYHGHWNIECAGWSLTLCTLLWDFFNHSPELDFIRLVPHRPAINPGQALKGYFAHEMFNFEVDTRGVPAPKTQGQQGFGVMTYTATLKYLMYNTGEKRDAYTVCADVLLPMGDI